ncbi:alpha/beta hydrolase fold domain-containing protein [Azospirillum melinis]|uniref:Alpha/beta hydrolase fold domain-containing protein n=1 Tax=Azospirillum melinis TaxID=328839 RepID=A0ABX2KBD5_9PROT|nr:acetyl esterase/lipase [Azospirillum melinis]NUA97924.1 alpha/beta hydrolase fold domain-containing protein [Azospirillum melinis]
MTGLRRITDWDDAYSNGAHIPGGDAYPARWAERAAAFRTELAAAGRTELDLPYGEGERERYDLFRPEGAAKGTVVFVHGGYWMAFDKGRWSHLAAGPLAQGWAVAMPSYTLCPETRIAGITRQMARAVEVIAGAEPRPLRLTGHSAGGHLVSRLVCADAPLSDDVRARVEHVVSISGLHDLRPLLNTRMNATLRLDEVEAVAESPALLRPQPGVGITCWVGADERPEFVRQTELLANIWLGLGVATGLRLAAGRHHFDVIDDLADPDSDLVAALLGF